MLTDRNCRSAPPDPEVRAKRSERADELVRVLDEDTRELRLKDPPWLGRPFTVAGRAVVLFLEDILLEAEEADLRLEFDTIAPPNFFPC